MLPGNQKNVTFNKFMSNANYTETLDDISFWDFLKINENIKKIHTFILSKQQILCHLAYIRITEEQITTKFA